MQSLDSSDHGRPFCVCVQLCMLKLYNKISVPTACLGRYIILAVPIVLDFVYFTTIYIIIINEISVNIQFV